MKTILFLFLSFIIGSNLWAQDVKIELGDSEIAANEVFTITISIENDVIESYDNFPEIPGFTKRGTSSSSSTNIINGQISRSQSVTQNYMPSGEGTYTLKSFYMKVNDEVYSSSGKTITVGPPVQSRRNYDPFRNDPFDDLFGRQEEQEFVEVEDDAFLAISTDKNQIYVGEGVNVVLAFYISENNRAQLQFFDLGRQLSEIIKKIKPANSWEENFNIDNINGKQVKINNKNYQQFTIYQATFFPLNTDTVHFPSVGLEMIKYKMAKSRSFFGQNRQEDYKTYHSRPKFVKVIDLPPHPLKDKVSVGKFNLKEKISGNEVKTGESFNFEFKIVGQGNIAGIEPPAIKQDQSLEIYPPSLNTSINRSDNKVWGSKTFSYYGIPKEPGIYNFDKYFNWVFFNPETHKYDTLQSEFMIDVEGKSKKNEYILSHDLGSFYNNINAESNNLINNNQDERIKMFVNIFILVMLVLTAVFIFRK